MLRFASSKLPIWIVKCGRAAHTNILDIKSEVSVPERADIVIIGGGSAGCNALYQLGRHGIQAVLVDKSKILSGTTWHTGGLVWSMRNTSDTDMQLLRITRHVLCSLEEETGVNPGWINNGGLHIAECKDRLNDYKRCVTLSKAFDIDAQLISNKEAKEKFPLLDEETFTAAVYCPGDGSVDPAMLINALTKSAKSHGCRIFEDCPVKKVLTKDNLFGHKEVCGVETAYGTIKTDVVLVACGAWSKDVVNDMGLNIPLVPMKHAYVVTEPIEGTQGLPNIRDPDISLYFKTQGGSFSIGGYEPNPIILQSVPKDFSFSLYELDWNVFNTHMEHMIKLLPILSTTGIRTTVCGPESFTPDHKPIMGEDPRCKGLYYSCGYNSAGMMLGGGCGQQAALWMINGRPDMHMFAYDIRRFLPEQTSNLIWATERSQEAYAKNFNIIFPHDEALSGRNVKQDPFHNLLIEEGAVMEERQGWERPGWFMSGKQIKILPYDYDGYYNTAKNENDEYRRILQADYTFDYPAHHNIIGKEALSCRERAALFDLSYFGKFYLCGTEAQAAADYIFTSNMNRNFNKVIYTCTLNTSGGVESDCTVTAIEPGSSGLVDPIFKGRAFYIVSGGLSAYQTWAHISKAIKEKKFDVSLHDVTDQIGVLSIQGPKSLEILQTLVEDQIFIETLPLLTSKLTRIRGDLVRIFRISFVGELGFELHIPKQSCERIYKAVKESGKTSGLQLAGYRALYSLSCEKGYHLWNTDLRIDDNPIEAGLGFLCRKSGEYLGKTAVDHVLKNGTKKKRVHVHLKNDIPIWGHETIYRDDHLIGYLRRAEYGYTFGHGVGTGYISHPDGHHITSEFVQSGVYEIEIMGKRYPANVYLESPFDPKNKRLLGMYDY